MLKLRNIFCLLCLLICSLVKAEEFTIQKIHVVGLQRITLNTVLSYLPIKAGDRINSSQTADIIRAIYKTGFFSDVKVRRAGNELLINVIERAVIGSVVVNGNKKINKKQLQDILKIAGIANGQALDQSILNSLEQALRQQYKALGMYAAKVKTRVQSAEPGRVILHIDIDEGPVAKIKSIKIIGAKAFKAKTLIGEFSLATTKLWSFITDSDQYSKEKFDADLEVLHSYYLDRGYLHYKLNSTHVAITPDKKDIYITIDITEGPIYKIKNVAVTGNLLGKEAEINKIIQIKAGDTFSREAIIETQNAIALYLGDFGYGMPDIKIAPSVDDTTRQVAIKFTVDPGKRLYVRRINFIGNNKTHDEVLRREMRLQEGSQFSLSKIQESKRRLANLGYLQDVDFKTDPVLENSDQVDLTYTVKETSSTTASFQAGFSDADGFLYGISLNEQNFLGTGKAASVGFNNSKNTQYYNFSYYDPYFTINHISLLLTGYFQKTDPTSDQAAYTTNVYGFSIAHGVPLFSDNFRFNFGYGFEHIIISTSDALGFKVWNFLNKFGKVYNDAKLTTSLSYSNLDRAIFPNQGWGHSLSFELGVPCDKHSLEYYRTDYNFSWYQPIYKSFIFHTRGEAGYGDGIGRNKDLPFLKNFFAGGIDSVRGFEAGSLGPRDYPYGNNLGGNLLTTASASIIFPNPVGESLRSSIFVDIGNVYDRTFRASELRSSYGVQIEWRTPLAPIILGIGKPIKKKTGDNLNQFLFSISTSI